MPVNADASASARSTGSWRQSPVTFTFDRKGKPRPALTSCSPRDTPPDARGDDEVYRDGINSLRDSVGRARVQVRVDRLAHGNPGQHRALNHGVRELKIDVGPGYLVYYTEHAGVLIVLLSGGDKSSQQQDIKTAIALAKGLQEQ